MLYSLIDDNEISALRLAPIFQGLKDEVIGEILQVAQVKVYERDTNLFVQGDPAEAIYIILKGWVKIYRITPAGDEALVNVFARGESFAEAAAFIKGEYPASGTTVTDCRLLRISARHLVAVIKRTPEVGLAMLGASSQRIHMLVQQIEQLKAHTGAQRLASFLLSLTEERSGSCTLELPYDKALIASRLGIKPESLSRAFQKLRGYGVSVKRNLAIIEDLQILDEMVQLERAVVMQKKLSPPSTQLTKLTGKL